MDEGTEIKKNTCNARIEEIAKPNKRAVLSLWQNYAYLFTEKRQNEIRTLLEELYSMTPEETEKYFNEISKVLKKIEAREKLKKRLYWRYQQRRRRLERRRACNKFRQMFVKVFTYACKHPPTPLVSPRLRCMSDVILDQICDIRGFDVPDRSNVGREAQFLFNLADWISIGIEHIYYEIHVHKNKEMRKIEREERRKRRAASLRSRSRSRKSGSQKSFATTGTYTPSIH